MSQAEKQSTQDSLKQDPLTQYVDDNNVRTIMKDAVLKLLTDQPDGGKDLYKCLGDYFHHLAGADSAQTTSTTHDVMSCKLMEAPKSEKIQKEMESDMKKIMKDEALQKIIKSKWFECRAQKDVLIQATKTGDQSGSDNQFLQECQTLINHIKKVQFTDETSLKAFQDKFQEIDDEVPGLWAKLDYKEALKSWADEHIEIHAEMQKDNEPENWKRFADHAQKAPVAPDTDCEYESQFVEKDMYQKMDPKKDLKDYVKSRDEVRQRRSERAKEEAKREAFEEVKKMIRSGADLESIKASEAWVLFPPEDKAYYETNFDAIKEAFCVELYKW